MLRGLTKNIGKASRKAVSRFDDVVEEAPITKALDEPMPLSEPVEPVRPSLVTRPAPEPEMAVADEAIDFGTPPKPVAPEGSNTFEVLGLDQEKIDAWRKANKLERKKSPEQDYMKERAVELEEGRLSKEEFRKLSDEKTPYSIQEEVPPLVSFEGLASALSKDKPNKGFVGLNKEIPEGTRVGSRFDINAYQDYGVYPATLHTAGAAKDVLGYARTAVLRNVKLEASSDKSIKIAKGGAKSPFIQMEGDWVNHDSEKVREFAQRAINSPEWVQVGVNPAKSGTFVTLRKDPVTGRVIPKPITRADTVIQIGKMVLAKINPEDEMDWGKYYEKNTFAEGGMITKNRIVGEGIAPRGLRHSSFSTKGKGYFGEIPDKEGNKITELSAESDRVDGEFPLIVPTLSRSELNHLVGGGEPTDAIYDKAEEWAIKRIKEGKSPFATSNDLRRPKPNDSLKFNKGGITTQTERLFAEGGMMDDGMDKDPVSGNDVPVGSLAEEVRDDIDAKLSPGEFVFPADVVRFIGLERLMKMRDQAKKGLSRMNNIGQMGNAEEVGEKADDTFESEEEDDEDTSEFESNIDEVMSEVDGEQNFNVGGVVQPSYYDLSKAPKNPALDIRYFKNEEDGATIYMPHINGKPMHPVPNGFSVVDKTTATTPSPTKPKEPEPVKTGDTQDLTTIKDERAEPSRVANQVGIDGNNALDTWGKGKHNQQTANAFIPKDFDWKNYVGQNEDLRKAGIDTEAEAKRHYIQFGAAEGRIGAGTANEYGTLAKSLTDKWKTFKGDAAGQLGIGGAGTAEAEIGGRPLSAVAGDFVNQLASKGIKDISKLPDGMVGWTAEGNGNVTFYKKGNDIIPVWGSSSDAATVRKVGIALAASAIGGPMLQGALTPTLGAVGGKIASGALIGGATSKAMGGDFVKGALTGAVGAGVSQAVTGFAGETFRNIGSSVAESTGNATVGKAVESALTKATSAGVTAGLTGGDIGQAATAGAVGGAVGTGVNATLTDTDPIVKSAIAAASTAVLLGQDPEKAALDALLRGGFGRAGKATREYVKNKINTGFDWDGDGGG